MKNIRHVLAALLVLPALAACESGGAAAAEGVSLAGTYTGSIASATGPLTYRLTVPETRESSFAVTGTVTDARGTRQVHGSARYQHPTISFELVRVDRNVESVFGVSGTVSDSRREIFIPRGDASLTLAKHQ